MLRNSALHTSKVQSSNAVRIVSWISPSVRVSILAVASSRTRILECRNSARAMHTNCLSPTWRRGLKIRRENVCWICYNEWMCTSSIDQTEKLLPFSTTWASSPCGNALMASLMCAFSKRQAKMLRRHKRNRTTLMYRKGMKSKARKMKQSITTQSSKPRAPHNSASVCSENGSRL